MAEQHFVVTLTPGLDISKQDITVSGTVADPVANQVGVGFGAGVRTGRGSEIVNAMEWLLNGVRDRNLLEDGSPDFNGADLVTAVSVDAIGVSDRRTSSSLAGSTFAAGDIVLTMGLTTTALQHRNIIDNAFEMLRRSVQEFLHING